MSTFLFHIEITTFLLLIIVSWPQIEIKHMSCSRDNSRLVRKIIHSKWQPILDQYKVKLPIDCPFHTFRDIFWPTQKAKKKNRPTQWTCSLCGKSFFSEKYIEDHLEKHDVINQAEDAICLADFCDVMRCDVWSNQDLPQSFSSVTTDVEIWKDKTNNIPQGSLIRIDPTASERKFLPDTKPNNVLKKSQISMLKFLRRKPCKSNMEENKKYSSSQNPTFTSTNSNENEGDTTNAKTFTSNHTFNKQNFSININGTENPKFYRKCDPESMARTKFKCEYIVRKCIAGLLLELTDLQFKELENELNRVVCWYLTCERYWEDGPIHMKSFPWAILFLGIFIVSLGISFCYYIIFIRYETVEYNNSRDVVYRSPHNTNSIRRRTPSTNSRYSTTTTNPRYRENSNVPNLQQQQQQQKQMQQQSQQKQSNQLQPHQHHQQQQQQQQQHHHQKQPSSQQQQQQLHRNIIDYDKDMICSESIDIRNDNVTPVQNNHYIYVTYPTDIKKQLFESNY